MLQFLSISLILALGTTGKSLASFLCTPPSLQVFIDEIPLSLFFSKQGGDKNSSVHAQMPLFIPPFKQTMPEPKLMVSNKSQTTQWIPAWWGQAGMEKCLLCST